MPVLPRLATANDQIVMDRWITIQQRTEKNSYGQPSGPWTDFAATWAKIEHLTGKEVVTTANNTLEAEITDRFTCPYVPGVNATMRVKYVDLEKTRYFDIAFPQNVEQRYVFLVILAKEIYSNT